MEKRRMDVVVVLIDASADAMADDAIRLKDL